MYSKFKCGGKSTIFLLSQIINFATINKCFQELDRQMADFSVRDKVVAITGGSGVIGSSPARSFVEAGANVAILNRTRDKIEALCQELGSGERVMGIGCDVLNKKALHQNKKLLPNEDEPLRIEVKK